MAEERLALSELLEKTCDGDFLRSVAEAVLQLLMEEDVDGLIGAGRDGDARRSTMESAVKGAAQNKLHLVGRSAACFSLPENLHQLDGRDLLAGAIPR